jgi:hypothetical protein
MMRLRCWPRGLPAHTALKLVLPLLLPLTLPAAILRLGGAQEPPPAAAAVALSLPQCLHLAFQRQPRLAALRASLAAAEDSSRALENLRLAAAFDREIPVRRRQAALGITAASAAVDQMERETVYAVTRTYFTVLYAREQERVARSVVERLSTLHDVAKRQLDAGAANVTDPDVKRTKVYLNIAKTKQTQAAQGVKRALVALKEAIGLAPDAPLEVPDEPLPTPSAQPSEDEVVGGALARRGELIRAGIFAEVTCLEIEAQGTSIHPKMATFAAGSDIHALQVPQEAHNTEYRPGALPPEMPTLLVGSRPERMERARALHMRAVAVVEVTRNLIALEAADAFLRWEQAAQQVADARAAIETAEQLAKDLTKDFTAGARVKVEDVVNARVLAAQARSQYNEFLYRQILALADLERVTAGAFCAGLVEAPPRVAPAATKNGGGQ